MMLLNKSKSVYLNTRSVLLNGTFLRRFFKTWIGVAVKWIAVVQVSGKKDWREFKGTFGSKIRLYTRKPHDIRATEHASKTSVKKRAQFVIHRGHESDLEDIIDNLCPYHKKLTQVIKKEI